MRGDVNVEGRIFFGNAGPDFPHRGDFSIAECRGIRILAIGRRRAGAVTAPGGIAAAAEIEIELGGCAAVAVQSRNRADADRNGSAADGASSAAAGVGGDAGIIGIHLGVNGGECSQIRRQIVETAVVERAEQHSRLEHRQLHRAANLRL